MKNLVDKLRIIGLKEQGYSNREVARMTKCNRKTVGRYWNTYLEQKNELDNPAVDQKALQEEITSKPKYDTRKRSRRKFTIEMENRLCEILEAEEKKNKILGIHKQQLTKIQIHAMLVEEGFDIGISTVRLEVNRLLKSVKECFVRQDYSYGDRLEYDFGEVKLEIDGKTGTYHMAVLSSPAGEFRWAYLYTNQKKEVFMDSHVKFFEMVGGCYREIVYDNMRNVVAKFIGRNEKQLNEDLLKMSLYYGFDINVTNCFKGNEKGYVESSVKILRNQIFALHYRFHSLEDAQEYLHSRLTKFNEHSKLSEEKEWLLPYKPELELAEISQNDVNSYSFICVDNNFYSVPDYLVGKKVTVKKYFNEIYVYSENVQVCRHLRRDGNKEMSVDIMHYLNTLLRKPGAVRNSLALKQVPELKKIFDLYYHKKPRQFIETLRQNDGMELDDIIEVFKIKITEKDALALDALKSSSSIGTATRNQIALYNSLKVGGDVV